MSCEPLERRAFESTDLLHEHPPRFTNPNKLAIWERIRAAGAPIEGPMAYARWPERELPEAPATAGAVDVRAGIFSYDDPPKEGVVHWHLNFADPCLFVAYSGGLLAQDEMQVLEHPLLGSLRDALADEGSEPMTCDPAGAATPVTVTGAQRLCAIETAPAPDRPEGLYGNRFAAADRDQVLAATRVLVPPTVSHILAIAAPACGRGAYGPEEIGSILRTAFSGFAAAAEESKPLGGESARTVIHTGFWGCGAFGGNRTLMILLQLFAGDLAGVDLVLHSPEPGGIELIGDARREYGRLREARAPTESCIAALAERRYEWGVSDGN